MPEPILVSIAAALAGKGATTLYDLVKKKFAGSPEATTALEEARGGGPDSTHVYTLSEELACAERADPVFATDLRAVWRQMSVRQYVDNDSVANQITGTVTGKVVQAPRYRGWSELLNLRLTTPTGYLLTLVSLPAPTRIGPRSQKLSTSKLMLTNQIGTDLACFDAGV